MAGKLARAENAGKVPPFIDGRLGHQDESAIDLKLFESHFGIPAPWGNLPRQGIVQRAAERTQTSSRLACSLPRPMEVITTATQTTGAFRGLRVGTERNVKQNIGTPKSVACRLCVAAPLVEILDLGRLPLANALVDSSALTSKDPTFPLVLRFCPSCSLVQSDQAASPEGLFRDYVYFSSYSDTMTAHARDLAARMVAAHGLGLNSLVIEARAMTATC
jgi:hypothetical protein